MRRGAGQHGPIKEVENTNETRPLNDYISAEEKLAISLEMAKAVAVMHGFVGGAVVHADIQLSQFFRGRDGIIKIVDYNRAEPLLYGQDRGEDCAWASGSPGDDTLRASEENIDTPLTEKINVYSLDNALYGVLTGKRVQEDISDRRDMEQCVVDRRAVHILHSYYQTPSSRLLAEAIINCWSYDARDRASIFWLVEFLEQAVVQHRVADETLR